MGVAGDGSPLGHPGGVSASVVAPPPPRWLAVVASSGFFLTLGYVLVQHVRAHWSDVFALGVLALAVLGGVLALDRVLGGSDWLRRHRRAVLAIGFLGVFLVQLLFIRETYATVGWDPRAVFAAAIDLSHFTQSPLAVFTPETYTSPGLSVSYWSSYPNNLLLAFVYEMVFRFCALVGLPSAVFMCTALNVLVLDVAILLAALCAGRLWGSSAERMTLLVAVPLLGFSPWISIAYSDTIATVFPVLVLYLYLRYIEATQREQYLYAAAIGAVSAVGYLLKPHVLAMTLAIGIVHALSGGSGSPLRSRLSKLATCALVAVIVVGGFGAYRDYRLRDRITKAQLEESRFPISHFIAMSLNDEWGGYNKPDVDAQRALKGTAAKNERNIRVIKARLKELGALGYAGFLHRKLTWITTDGTFFWQSEGNLSHYVPFHDGSFARIVQSVVYREGEHFRWFAVTANALWLAVLISMMAPVATRRRFDADRAVLIGRLATIILLLMLLVLEGRSRYLISFVPVFVLLGSYYLSGVPDGRFGRRRASGEEHAPPAAGAIDS